MRTEPINYWKIATRRGFLCVEGALDSGDLIHVYVKYFDVNTGKVICAETGREYRLTGYRVKGI